MFASFFFFPPPVTSISELGKNKLILSISFLTSLVQSPGKKIKMLKQGIFSPLDELLYNKLPAGVRKPEINGFLLPRKLTRGIHAEELSQRDGHPHTNLCICSSFYLKPFLSSASPPSLLPSPRRAASIQGKMPAMSLPCLEVKE